MELTEKSEDESEDQIANKPTLKSRMASFFRVNKGFTADEEKKEDEAKNGDVTENGETKIDLNDVEKESEKEEEATAEGDQVVVEKEKKGKSLKSLMTKMFKRDAVADKTAEEPVKVETNEDSEDQKPEEEKKVVEEEKTTAEEEKKEPTPNTSF